MKFFPRQTTASLLLAALLLQIFMPVYSARAVVLPVKDVLVGTNTTVLVSITSSTLGPIAANTTALNANAQKESFWQHVLNVAAYAAINIVLQTVTNQIIGWIKGTDSNFVQNLKQEATRTADAEVGGLLVDLTGINLCGNIGAFLKLSLGAPGASVRQRFQCSVTDIVGNFENFYQDFTNGGWPAFFQVALEPQNNAYGAFLLSLDLQAQRKDGAQANLLQGLAQGSGFKGFQVAREANCRSVSADDADTMRQFIDLQSQNGKPTRKVVEEAPSEAPEAISYRACDIEYDTKTPGKLFADALPAAAFSGLRRTELANTVDQAIGQIVLALLQRIIKESVGAGKGIFGSPDIGAPTPATLADGGFRPTYLTNQTDDTALRLGASESLLDAKIRDIDTRIAAITAQIAPLETACAAPNPGDTCQQTRIDELKSDRATLEQERADILPVLSRAHRDMTDILDLRARLLTATDISLLENLGTKLTGIQTDAANVIQLAGGPPVGQNGLDADSDFVKIVTGVRDRAADTTAYLDKRIADEQDADKKTRLTTLRDDIKKLGADLDILRGDFLAAISDDVSTAGIMARITGKTGDIHDKILSVYSL